MRTALAVIGGLVLGWLLGIALIAAIRWVSLQLGDSAVVLKGLEFVLALAGALTAAALTSRRAR